MHIHYSRQARGARRLGVLAACLAVAAAMLATGVRAQAAAGPVPPVPTPAAHWTFDEGSGTTAADSSGNGHTATLGAGASWTAGNVGSHALALNGTAAGVATVPGPVVDTSGSFTVGAWVKLNNLNGYQTVVSIAGTTVAGFFLGLRADTGTWSFARLGSDANVGATVVAAPTAPSTGVWYHLVAVDNATAGTMSLYVDRQLIGTATYTANWKATGDTLIGHGFYNGGQVDYVNGAIDDVEMFSSALSADQVAALDEPAAYPFDDGSGSTATDASGHGNTLTLGSGASWTTGSTPGSSALAVNGTATGNATAPGPVLDTAQPFTVSAWVKLNSTTGWQTFASMDGTQVSGFYLQLRADTGRFAFARLASDNNAAAATHADATFTPVTGKWYNLIGVNDVADGLLKLYVNGVLQSSVPYTGGWTATGPTVVGGGMYAGARSDFVNGTIDDVRFFDSPLNDQDALLIGTNGASTLDVNTASTGATVSPTLFGAMMEDINYGGDGGIYNDEIRNSGFNDATNPLNAWSAVAGTGVTDSLAADPTTGPTAALTSSAKLTITSGVSGSGRAGIANSGYFGVAVAPSTTYHVSFFAKATAGFQGPLIVDLESASGVVWAQAKVTSVTSTWAQYTATLTTSASTPTTATNKLVIATTNPKDDGSTIWFGAAYLFPPSYKGAANHLRIDLMQKLAALKPAVFRVPGGNFLEGENYANRFEWANTLGPVWDRPGHMNPWGYWSTDGMGIDEYMQMAEEAGAQPILAVYAGYTLNGSSDTGATLSADVQDAVNEIHYLTDPVTTTWGAERAANGHSAPYKIKQVEIGNEDFFSSTYATRYPLFYTAIHTAFPSLQIIATGTNTGGAPYDILDEHFYNSPSWFEAHSDYFNTADRSGPKIFIGEYAANEGYPTNDLNSALGDASWLLGLERNSDVVTESSYAPLWANVNGLQWWPDLIGFNNTTSYGSPSYYAQVMLSHNHGTKVISDRLSGSPGLVALVTRTKQTYYLTVVNTGGAAHPATINLNGVSSTDTTATSTTLSGSSTQATNSITDPANVVPVTTTVSGIGTSFTHTFAPYSITILKFNAQ